MFKIFKEYSVKRINITAILFAGIFVALSAFVVIFNEYRGYKKEIAAVEKSYLQNQKKRVVEQTSRLYRLIKYRYDNFKDYEQSMLSHHIVEEVSIVLDDFNTGDYIFIYDKNRKIVYKSRELKYDDSALDLLFEKAEEAGVLLTLKIEKDDSFVENILFVREFKELGWVIGSGVCLYQKDKALAQITQEHQNQISGFILKIVTLTLFLYLATIFQYRYVTDKLSKEIRFIAKSLKNASKSYTPIDRNRIKFKEFRQIISQANYMLLELKEKESALGELNLNLENLVEDKTKELKKSIAYTNELLEYQDIFLKNAIHEINTPLSIILINIDLYNLKFERNPYLIKIEAAVKVLENIYGDLSFIVKKDREVRRVDMINFTDFLNDRVEYFADVATGNRLKIKSEIQNDVMIMFNEFELQRLCDNNISNAIKYSHINRNILIKLYNSDESIVFEVQNYGEKINDINNIFQRYYREDSARGGFGLGLNIVKDICDTNSIHVEVESDELRTVFRYYFKQQKEDLS